MRNNADEEEGSFSIPFVKLEGNGNDFILIDETAGELLPESLKGEFAYIYCDRRFGIGGDGVLFLLRSESADIKMRLFQPDRSEAEMCGNGIRCLVKYAYDCGYINEHCIVETAAGDLEVELGYDEEGDFSAIIDMGPVLFEAVGIPAEGEGEYLREINDYEVRAVNTGVPHAVVFVDSLEDLDIKEVAPPIRHHESFPKGANVNFVEVMGDDEISVRTFERGVEGETLSCGTGSTACAAVAYRTGRTGGIVLVNTVGGPLTIRLEGVNPEGMKAFMEGPAETVFSGLIWA